MCAAKCSMRSASMPAASSCTLPTRMPGPASAPKTPTNPAVSVIPMYLANLRDACAEAAREALRNEAPGRLEWAYGRCDLARNRDLQDPAADRIVCGFNPESPADDTLLIGRAIAANGAMLATLVNYACHPVTLAWQNTLISPDFVGAMRELVETRYRRALSVSAWRGGRAGAAPALQRRCRRRRQERSRARPCRVGVLHNMLPPGQRPAVTMAWSNPARRWRSGSARRANTRQRHERARAHRGDRTAAQTAAGGG